MDLVVHHVLQPLVVGGAKEDLGVELATSEAIVEDLITPQMVPVLSKQVRDLLHVHSIIERCGVSDLPLVGRNLSKGSNNSSHQEEERRRGLATPTLPWRHSIK